MVGIRVLLFFLEHGDLVSRTALSWLSFKDGAVNHGHLREGEDWILISFCEPIAIQGYNSIFDCKICCLKRLIIEHEDISTRVWGIESHILDLLTCEHGASEEPESKEFYCPIREANRLSPQLCRRR